MAPGGIQRARRLVEEQQPRIADERLREPEALLHALGHGTDAAIGDAAELSRAGGVEVETASGWRLFAEGTREDAPRIVRELVAAGEEVFGVRLLTSTLEDAYLEAVGRAPAPQPEAEAAA